MVFIRASTIVYDQIGKNEEGSHDACFSYKQVWIMAVRFSNNNFSPIIVFHHFFQQSLLDGSDLLYVFSE